MIPTRIASLFILVAVAGCADFDAPVNPYHGIPDELVANPSFADDILPILTRRCSIGGCHSLASEQSELTLTADEAYDDLVEEESEQNSLYKRVRASKPDSSWLVKLIVADPSGRGSFARMPLLSTPLTENQIGTIINWIAQGAQRN